MTAVHPPRSLLKYDRLTARHFDLDHEVANLRCLLREAHATGRLAVVPPLNLLPKHNLGVWRDWKWETYFDFGESTLIDAEGREHPLPVARGEPDVGVPVLSVRPKNSVPLATSDGAQATLAIRQMRHDTYPHDLPANQSVSASAIKIRLRSSLRVRKLAQAAVAQLQALDDGRFAAVHVLRGTRLDRAEYPSRLTEPAHIRDCLTRHDIPDGAVLFVMSDERMPDFFQPLNQHYRLFRYLNFPKLRALVSPAADQASPDNYLLYQVEREIAKHASLRLDTIPRKSRSEHALQGPQGFLVSKEEWKPSGDLRVPRLFAGVATKSEPRLKQLRAILSPAVPKTDIVRALAQGRFDEAWRIAQVRIWARSVGRTPPHIVSHRHRYLWICNPKVASRSITNALLCLDPSAKIIREDIPRIHARYPATKDYFTFAFIRHPFDRALSLYSEIHFSADAYSGLLGEKKRAKRQYLQDQCYGLKKVDTFEQYCRWLNTRFGSDPLADQHFLSQHLAIRLPDGRLPDFVGRMENIEDDLKHVASQLGLSVPKLPRLNTMTGWEASSGEALEAARAKRAPYLTEEAKALLTRRYGEDLELYQQAVNGTDLQRSSHPAEGHETGEWCILRPLLRGAVYDESGSLSTEFGAFMRICLKTAFPADRRADLKVLDCGCGTGKMLRVLQDFLDERAPACHRYYGFDLSPDLIERARRRFHDVPPPRLRAGDVLDAQSYAFDAEEPLFDLVYCKSVVEQLPRAQQFRVVETMLEHVAPGGAAIFFEKDRHSRWGVAMGVAKIVTRYLGVPLVPRSYCVAHYPPLAGFGRRLAKQPRQDRLFRPTLLTMSDGRMRALVIGVEEASARS